MSDIYYVIGTFDNTGQVILASNLEKERSDVKIYKIFRDIQSWAINQVEGQ